MERPDWIEVGRIARPHGVRGEVRVTPETDNPDRFQPGSVLYARAREGEERETLEIEGVRGEERFPIVAFRGVEDRSRAEGLKGAVLVVPGKELPDLEEGEFYPWELVGLRVLLADGREFGTVTEFLESPANDLLAVTSREGERVLVPFVLEVVPEVDVAAGYLTIAEAVLPEDIPGRDRRAG